MTESLLDPNREDTTPGMREKKPPAQNPLITANAVLLSSSVSLRHPSEERRTHNGPTLSATGQITNVLTPTSAKHVTTELTLPMSLSAKKPNAIRPTAEARLNPARMRAAVAGEREMEVA